MKTKFAFLLTLLGFATAASAQATPPPYYLDVKIVAIAGTGIDHPVYRSNFNSLSERVNLTPPQGPTMKRVAFGIRGEVKNAAGALVSATIRFTENPKWQMWKDGVPYGSVQTIPIFNKPLDSYGTGSTDTARFTRPDLYGTTSAGVLTTGDFTSSTTAFTGSTFYAADTKLALGTDIGANGIEVPSPHSPMTATPGSGYTVGYTLRGYVDIPGTDEGDFSFVILPGHHIPSEPTIMDTATPTFLFKRLATVWVAPSLSLDEWVAQLKTGDTAVEDGKQTQSFTDPSGLVDQPYGYRIIGFDASTDLVRWFFAGGWVTVTTPANEIKIVSYPFADNPSRLFFRAVAGYAAP